MKRFHILTAVIILIMLSQCEYVPFGSLGLDLYLSSPQNGSEGVSTSPTLEWLDPFYGGKPRKFLLYLSEDLNEVLENSKNALIGETNDSRFEVKGLKKGKTYYWKVIGEKGNTKISSPVWKFKTNNFKVAKNKNLGSPYEDGAFSVKALKDGYILGGYIGYLLNEYHDSTGAPAVFRINEDGDLIWMSRLGDNGTIYDIEVTDGDKNIIAVGVDNSGVSPAVSGVVSKLSVNDGKVLFKKDLAPNSTLFGIAPGNSHFVAVGTYMFGSPDSDIVMLKFDSSGNCIKKNVLDYGSKDYAHDVIATKSGYIVVGSSDENGLIIFLDKDLEVKSYKLINDCTSFYKVIALNGKYIAIGYSDKAKTFYCPDGGEINDSRISPCITTIDESGDILSTKRFFSGCSSYHFVPYSATVVGSDILLLVGVRTLTFSNNTFYEYPFHFENAVSDPDDNQDLMIMKLTSSGSVTGYEHFGGSYEDGGFDITEKDGDLAIIGRTWSNDGDIAQNLGKSDVWFLKITER